MENKRKHLEFIQIIINRMANNSFLLKGWSITVASGLSAVGISSLDMRYFAISMLVLVFFWILDSYYLHQEKLFRELYKQTARRDESAIDFLMETGKDVMETGKDVSWPGCMFSGTLLLFYGMLIIVYGLVALGF